jgi:VanZ family protein
MKRERIHWFAWVCWLGVAIWTCTVFWLSSRAGDDLADDFPFIMEAWDKFLHFIAFFCGVIPLVSGFRLSTNWPWKKVFWVSVACISLYGALDEVHQLWTPSRSGLSIGDWTADTLGAVAGAAVGMAVHKWIERRMARKAAPPGVNSLAEHAAVEEPR